MPYVTSQSAVRKRSSKPAPNKKNEVIDDAGLEYVIAGQRWKRHFTGGVLAFRFLVAVDAEGFSRCCAAEQAGIQDDLDRALARAARAAGMDRARWICQPRGDGELAELPLDIDDLSLAGDFPRQLAAAIS